MRNPKKVTICVSSADPFSKNTELLSFINVSFYEHCLVLAFLLIFPQIIMANIILYKYYTDSRSYKEYKVKVSAINKQISFGRALTTKETAEYKKAKQEARKQLELDKTTAVVFDFSTPSGKRDTGIGTSVSDKAHEMMGFLNAMCDINSIQLQPQGEISNAVRSPYSGTSFSIGEHIIDLTKLQEEKYGKLLAPEDYEAPFFNRVENHDTVDYDNIFAQDGQTAVLKKAYTRFKTLDETSPLKQEFDAFKKENRYWLERDALYEAAATENGTENMNDWNERDKNIFAAPQGDTQRIAELKKVSDENGNNVVDYEEFVQFIADKQLNESKKAYNEQGIDVYGDSKIGFSQKDYWAHKSAFADNCEFGCDIGNGKYSCWSPAIDFNRLQGEAGDLLYHKFDTFFKRYDGVRIDAAWQLINPLLCEPKQENGKDVFDSDGNKLGNRLENQPQVPDNGKYIMNNIILKAAKNNGVSPDKVFLELLGGNSYDSLNAVRNTGTTLTHITRYGSPDWGRVKFYESTGGNNYQNMRSGDYTIGVGTHDDTSLVEQAREARPRAGYLAHDLRLDQRTLENSQEARANALTAELYTTKNQFATLPDILGFDRRINIPNTLEGNWSYRATQDYERSYFDNLSNGRGFNTADAYATALKAKQNGHVSHLTRTLEKFADILRAKGPMTTEEADSQL